MTYIIHYVQQEIFMRSALYYLHVLPRTASQPEEYLFFLRFLFIKYSKIQLKMRSNMAG